jgi:hypothetical protein
MFMANNERGVMKTFNGKPMAIGPKQAFRAAELLLKLARKKAKAADENAKRFRKKMKAAKKAAKRAKKAAKQAKVQLATAEQAFADAKAKIAEPILKTSPITLATKTKAVVARPARNRPIHKRKRPVVAASKPAHKQVSARPRPAPQNATRKAPAKPAEPSQPAIPATSVPPFEARLPLPRGFMAKPTIPVPVAPPEVEPARPVPPPNPAPPGPELRP